VIYVKGATAGCERQAFAREAEDEELQKEPMKKGWLR